MHTKWFYPIVAAAFALAIGGYAQAADLQPVFKIKQMRILQSYVGSGWYYGVHTFAENDKIEVAGTAPTANGVLTGLGGTFSVGAAVGLTGGYLWGNGATWRAIEVLASYKNISGGIAAIDPNTGVVIPGNVASKWSMTERFKFGGSLASIVDLLPNLSTVFPVLPTVNFPNQVAGTTHPYLFGAVHEDDVSASFGLANGRAWRIKAGLGVGAMTQLTSGVVMDVWIEYIPAASGINLGAPNGTTAVANTGRETRIGLGAYW